MSSAPRIEPLRDKTDRRRFIDLPKHLHAGDPNWIAPLDMEIRELLDTNQPFYAHGVSAQWLATDDGRTVGRISAQIDHLHEQEHGERVGYFGLLEAEDRADVFHALLDTACAWLRERGCVSVRGPFDLSINQRCGLLVEGFERPPYVMMGHAPHYYGERIEACGFARARDLLAYLLDVSKPTPAIAHKLARKYRQRIRLRHMGWSGRRRDLDAMRHIFNDAWAGNWGFVPFTRAEFDQMGRELLLVANRRQAQIADWDGAPGAIMVTLPDVNQAARELDGKLLPFGWARLLWRLKVSGVPGVRVALLGVRRDLQGSPAASALAFLLLTRAWELARADGHTEAELSWILEDNRNIRGIIEHVGGVAYKRYRIYEKDLETPASRQDPETADSADWRRFN